MSLVQSALPETRTGIGSISVRSAAIIGATLSLVVGIPLALVLNIWIDEAFTLHSTAHGVVDAWKAAIGFEIQPPVYFVIEAAWRQLDESSIAFARAPSLLFIAGGVAMLVVAANRIAPRMPPVVVAVCTALNAIAVWASVEMRVYPLVFFEATMLTWAFAAGFIARTPSRRAQIIYAVTALLGLYTQYFIGFLLLGHACAMLIARKQLRAYALAMIPVVLTFIPFFPVVRYHLSVNSDAVERMSIGRVAHEFFNTVFVYVLPHEPDWTGVVKPAGFGIAGLLVLALVFWGRPRLSAQARLTAIAWLISALTFAAVLARTGGDPFFRRHLIVLAPPAILLSYAFVSSLSQRRRLLQAVTAVVFAMFAAATLGHDYRPPPTKLGDWQRVAQTVGPAGHTPVVIFPAELALALGVYRTAGVTVPLPVPMPFDPSYVDARPLRSETQVARAFAALPTTTKQFWVVTAGPCAAIAVNFAFNCRYLETYLQAREQLVAERDFNGTQARLYERKVIRK